MEAMQCPRCALRFRHASELRDHLAHDHPAFRAQASTTAGDLLEACHCHHHQAGGEGPHADHMNNAA